MFRQRRLAPFDHRWQMPDPVGVSLTRAIQRDIIAAKAADDRRVHRIRHRYFAKQERAAVRLLAVTPDRLDALDVGLRIRPDIEFWNMAI